MVITNVSIQEFDNYVDFNLCFKIEQNSPYFDFFNLLIEKMYNDCGNQNLTFENYEFKYFNHCVKCKIVSGCFNELNDIKLSNVISYPTKDAEGIIYKIIKTLELFSY
mgnify:CR=1 FL=1